MVNHCKKALEENWFYLWGAYGQFATEQYFDQNFKQYPQNRKKILYLLNSLNKTKVSDCYGLVKSYLWETKNGLQYNSKEDNNTLKSFNLSKENGLINNMPDIVGLLLYMPGHIGIYTGENKFIECVGGEGIREGKIENGKIFKGSKFTHWFKDVNIRYLNEENSLDEIIININGQDEIIKRQLKDGYNMVYLREIVEKLNYDLIYSHLDKKILINTK